MTTKASIYAEHPAIKMVEKALAGLKEKTGKSNDEWTRALAKSGAKTTAERKAFLKESGVTTNYAKFVLEKIEGTGGYDPDALVATMFASKQELRPIYDRLLTLGMKLGKDVTVTPCATMIPLRRKFVFAQIKPTTKTRIDLGFALGTTKAKGRLVSTGGLEKGDRITHRMAIATLGEIDDEVKRWLKAAYDADG